MKRLNPFLFEPCNVDGIIIFLLKRKGIPQARNNLHMSV